MRTMTPSGAQQRSDPALRDPGATGLPSPYFVVTIKIETDTMGDPGQQCDKICQNFTGLAKIKKSLEQNVEC